MVISTTVYVEHPNISLAHTLQTLRDVEIGVVADAGTDPDHDVYFFWVEADDFGAVERALTEDHTVESFSIVVGTEGRRTYRIEYSDEVKLVAPAISEVGGVTMDARSHTRGWTLSLQLRDHDALYRLNEYAESEGIRLDVLELQQSDGNDARRDLGLTEAQREALVGAFVNGYYDEPREISLEELADLLDISTTAVSGRLRRGSARLVEAALLDEE